MVKYATSYRRHKKEQILEEKPEAEFLYIN